MWVVPLKHKNSYKTLLFCVCKNFSSYKDKVYMKDVIVTQSVPVYTHNLVTCIHKKVIRDETSDSDMREVDLNMQMTFLNAAP